MGTESITRFERAPAGIEPASGCQGGGRCQGMKRGPIDKRARLLYRGKERLHFRS